MMVNCLLETSKFFYSRSDEWEINRGFSPKDWDDACLKPDLLLLNREGRDATFQDYIIFATCLVPSLRFQPLVCRLSSLLHLRYAVVIRLLFLVGHLYVIWCMVRWGSKNTHYKDGTCFKEIRLRLQILLLTSHLIVKAIGRTCVRETNMRFH